MQTASAEAVTALAEVAIASAEVETAPMEAANSFYRNCDSPAEVAEALAGWHMS